MIGTQDQYRYKSEETGEKYMFLTVILVKIFPMVFKEMVQYGIGAR